MRHGNYVLPTVFADVDNRMRIAQEEIFGPVACLIPFDDEAGAIRLANESPYGLNGNVWTKDKEKGFEIACRIGSREMRGQVSARAEAQVRDRTKRRFRVPGAWRVENIEPKATLRALIAEGRWQAFRTAQLQSARTLFETHLRQRLQQAIAAGRLDAQHVAALIDVDGPAATDLAA